MEASQSPQSKLPEDDVEVDTVSLACQEREKQGPREVEFSYGGEADLHRHYSACTKNPGHQKFIPVDMFNADHLPADYQDKNLVDCVRVMCALTVRLSVSYVSEKRPATLYGSDSHYPCYNKRGQKVIRVGTGWVSFVDIFFDRKCECKECVNSPTPKTQYGYIYLRTAPHLVYDNLEGEHTTCHLFFDRDNTPESCYGVITLSGMSDVWGSDKVDFNNLRYITHDLELLEKLELMIGDCNHLLSTVQRTHGMYSYNTKTSPPQAESVSVVEQPLTIIASHPHGCSKQVSVGRCADSENKAIDCCQFNYTAATCPGSTGAFVFILGTNPECWSSNYYSHGGNSAESKDLNYSGRGLPLYPLYLFDP